MSNKNLPIGNVWYPHFGKKTAQEQQGDPTTETRDHTASNIVSILRELGVGKIYWERDIGNYCGYSEAQDFFRVVAEKRIVRYIEDPMDRHRIVQLKAIAGSGGEDYDISVEQFIHLTHLTPSEVTHPQQYIRDWLKKYQITSRKYKESDTIVRVPLQADDLDIYHPDTIFAIDTLYTGHYTCQLSSHLGPIGYGDLRNFAGESSTITLLDLMLAAYDDAEINDITTENSMMEVAKVEGQDIIYTAISQELIDTVIHAAIIRVYPLCQNMSVSQARKYYFDQVTLARITG